MASPTSPPIHWYLLSHQITAAGAVAIVVLDAQTHPLLWQMQHYLLQFTYQKPPSLLRGLLQAWILRICQKLSMYNWERNRDNRARAWAKLSWAKEKLDRTQQQQKQLGCTKIISTKYLLFDSVDSSVGWKSLVYGVNPLDWGPMFFFKKWIYLGSWNGFSWYGYFLDIFEWTLNSSSVSVAMMATAVMLATQSS